MAQTAEKLGETTETDVDASFVQDFARKVRENVQRVFVGKGDAIDLAIIAMLGRGHVLFEDVPGTGKTTLAKTIAGFVGVGVQSESSSRRIWCRRMCWE